MSECRIVLDREVPPDIVRLAHDQFSVYPCVRQVLFIVDKAKQLEGHLAVFVPDTGSVIIDLDACVHDLRWMDKGATFIANAWFNLLYSIYHEAQHAWQIMAERAPNEEACDEYALDRMFEWCETHPLPQVEDMGYIGERIKVVLNGLWMKHASVVENEIRVCGVVAAHAKIAAHKISHYEDQAQRAALMTAIEEGQVGKIISGEPYLTASEFIVALNPDAH